MVSICVRQVLSFRFSALGRKCNAWLGANHLMIPVFFPQISLGTHLELGQLWLGLQSHTRSKPKKKGKNSSKCGEYMPITVSSKLRSAGKNGSQRSYIEVWAQRQFEFRKHLSCAFTHRLLNHILAKAK